MATARRGARYSLAFASVDDFNDFGYGPDASDATALDHAPQSFTHAQEILLKLVGSRDSVRIREYCQRHNQRNLRGGALSAITSDIVNACVKTNDMEQLQCIMLFGTWVASDIKWSAEYFKNMEMFKAIFANVHQGYNWPFNQYHANYQVLDVAIECSNEGLEHILQTMRIPNVPLAVRHAITHGTPDTLRTIFRHCDPNDNATFYRTSVHRPESQANIDRGINNQIAQALSSAPYDNAVVVLKLDCMTLDRLQGVRRAFGTLNPSPPVEEQLLFEVRTREKRVKPHTLRVIGNLPFRSDDCGLCDPIAQANIYLFLVNSINPTVQTEYASVVRDAIMTPLTVLSRAPAL
jgi:hypothetical protein